MPARLFPDKISRALPWLSDSEAKSLFEGMKSAQKYGPASTLTKEVIAKVMNDEERAKELRALAEMSGQRVPLRKLSGRMSRN